MQQPQKKGANAPEQLKQDLDIVGNINSPYNLIFNIFGSKSSNPQSKIIISMKIKYIVKSERSPHIYLVADAELGPRKVPYAFKACRQILYEIAEFDSKEDALAACEEAAKYYNVEKYIPIILEKIS